MLQFPLLSIAMPLRKLRIPSLTWTAAASSQLVSWPVVFLVPSNSFHRAKQVISGHGPVYNPSMVSLCPQDEVQTPQDGMHGPSCFGLSILASFISGHQSTLSPAILNFPPLIFVMLWFSGQSLHMLFPLPRTLFSALAEPVCYLLKIHSFFSFCLQNPGNPGSQGKCVQALVQRWVYYPILANYLYKKVTLECLEGFFLSAKRKACK